MDYHARMKKRLEGGERFVPGFLGLKERVHQIADLVGVRTPAVFDAQPIRELISGELPDEFVLKPSFASTSIGVRLLRRSGDDFFDLVAEKEVSRNEIISDAEAVSLNYFPDGGEGSYLAEELLRGRDGHAPPHDIRAYAFQGEIGLILMEQHLTSPARAMYFDGDFLPFSDVDRRYGVAAGQEHLEAIEEARTPDSWSELLNVARRISTAMPTAFCRVDMYDTPKGVYLGEITFYPGTFITRTRKLMYQVEAERLGRLWGEAEARLHGSHEIRYGSEIREFRGGSL